MIEENKQYASLVEYCAGKIKRLKTPLTEEEKELIEKLEASLLKRQVPKRVQLRRNNRNVKEKETDSSSTAIEMQKYVIALRTRIQDRAKQLEQTCSDKEKCRFARLQDEIVALADLYRHYYREIFTEASKSYLEQINHIEQAEKIFTAAKAQMIEGNIGRTQLIEVAEKAKKNLRLICATGKLGQYTDLLLTEKQKEEEQEER